MTPAQPPGWGPKRSAATWTTTVTGPELSQRRRAVVPVWNRIPDDNTHDGTSAARRRDSIQLGGVVGVGGVSRSQEEVEGTRNHDPNQSPDPCDPVVVKDLFVTDDRDTECQRPGDEHPVEGVSM